MDCEKYKYLIQEFHDGELDKGKEAFIFTHLSTCSECRDFFSSLNTLSLAASEENTEFPSLLETRIFYSIDQKNTGNNILWVNKKVPAYVLYLLSVVIIAMGFYLFKSTTEYRNELHEAVQIVKQKDKEMQLIMNSLDEIKVESRFDNEIIIKAEL